MIKEHVSTGGCQQTSSHFDRVGLTYHTSENLRSVHLSCDCKSCYGGCPMTHNTFSPPYNPVSTVALPTPYSIVQPHHPTVRCHQSSHDWTMPSLLWEDVRPYVTGRYSSNSRVPRSNVSESRLCAKKYFHSKKLPTFREAADADTAKGNSY